MTIYLYFFRVVFEFGSIHTYLVVAVKLVNRLENAHVYKPILITMSGLYSS